MTSTCLMQSWNLWIRLYGLYKPLVLSLYSFWIPNADIELVALYFESKGYAYRNSWNHKSTNNTNMFLKFINDYCSKFLLLISFADILYLYMNCGLYDRLIYSNLDKIYCRKESTDTFHGRCRRQEVRFIDLHLFHSRIIQLISCIMLPLNEKPHNTF